MYGIADLTPDGLKNTKNLSASEGRDNSSRNILPKFGCSSVSYTWTLSIFTRVSRSLCRFPHGNNNGLPGQSEENIQPTVYTRTSTYVCSVHLHTYTYVCTLYVLRRGLIFV